jgi:hypothetical protein
MRILLAVSLFVAVTLAAEPPPRQDLVRIELVSPVQARDLDRLGVTIDEVRPGYCIAEAAPELVQALAGQGWKMTTLREDISGEYYRNSLTFSADGRYLAYQEFIDTMNTMAVNNPTVCHLETLAVTTTGKLVLAMKVSDNAAQDEAEPTIVWDANTHGDEKIGWAVAYEFLKYLLLNYGTNPEVTYLVDNREIWICPMFNPDGYVNSSRYNARNVDMNRNWGWMWGEEAAPGNKVMGEAETRGLASKLFDMPASILVSFHAGIEIISYPWSYTDDDSIPEDRAIDQLSAGYSSRGNSYDYGQGSLIMYLINGSSKDLGYGAMGAMAWSIEVHMTKTPPASEIDPTFVRNRDAMLWFCRVAGHGIQGTITDSLTGQPVRAQVWLGPYNWASFSDRVNGDYHRFQLPGTYSLTVMAPGYVPKTISNVVVPGTGDSAVVVDVTLSPSPAQPLFGFQVIACSAVAYGANRTYPVRALGVHDGVSYSVDNNKWIIIDMDQPIRNGSGIDFSVYRSSGSGTATIRAANDWAGPWTTVGTANSARTDFDLGGVGLDSARYIYVKASGQFLLDAIEAIPFTGIASRPLPAFRQSPELRAVPNLAVSAVRLECMPAPIRTLEFVVRDCAGRAVRRLRLNPGVSSTTLDLKDDAGQALGNGVYFAETSESALRPARFTVLR